MLTSPRVASKAARASAGWRSGGLSQRHTVRQAASSCGQPARPPPPSPLFISVPETGKRALAELRGGASPSQGIQKGAWPRLGRRWYPGGVGLVCPHRVTAHTAVPAHTASPAQRHCPHRYSHVLLFVTAVPILTPTPTLTLHAVRTLTPTPNPHQAQAQPYCTRTPPPYLACA